MPDLQDEAVHLDDPEHWSVAQLEYVDQQLTNHVRTRDRHRTDVQMYARIHATMPMRYHQTQADHCTTRIDELLDLRLRVVSRAAQGGQD